MEGIQSNGFLPIIAQAIAEMEAQHGEFSSIDEINLAELGRRTDLSRSKLRRLKANGFCEAAHGLVGKKKDRILDGYSAVLDRLLLRETGDAVTPQRPARPTRWTGASQMCWTTTETPTVRHALL